jgi:hypothetical protein
MIRSQKERESGGGLGFGTTDFEGIAIHSQILTALAEGGTFFLVYTGLILLSFWYLLTDATWHCLMPMRLSILISSLYALLMSPFSGIARLDIALGVVLTLVFVAEWRAYVSNRRREGPNVWSRQIVPGGHASQAI